MRVFAEVVGRTLPPRRKAIHPVARFTAWAWHASMSPLFRYPSDRGFMPCLTLISKAACEWACESSLARATHSTRSSSARAESVGFVSQQLHRLCLRHVAFRPWGPMLCKYPSGCPSGVKKHLDPRSTTPRWAHLELASAAVSADEEAAATLPLGASVPEALADDPLEPAAIGTPSSTSRSLPDCCSAMFSSFAERSRKISFNSAATDGPSKPEEVIYNLATKSMPPTNPMPPYRMLHNATPQNQSHIRRTHMTLFE
jgi:hypothetical protein